MDWTAISGMADTAAAFGVVGSLIFVGFQVRQNSTGLRNSAAQSLMATYQDLYSNIIDNGEVAQIVRQGFADPSKLDGDALFRYYAFSGKLLRIFQGMHWYWRRGAIDDGQFKSMTTVLEDTALNPGWRQVWSARRHQYEVEFQEFMDTMMSEEKGVPLFPEGIAEDG